ncbi:MAG: response regulator transcription factor, partial [Sphingobacteriaceae bacterium]
FLDIQMPELSGLDLVQAIGGKCSVILTTAYSEFAAEGFELEVMDYLVKPIRFPRFLKAVNRALKVLAPMEQEIIVENTLADDYLFVKTEMKGKMVKINLKDIDYVEGMKNYLAIYHGGLRTLALITMKEMESRLPERYFARAHKSFLVAVEKITMIEGSRVFLKNIPQDIPIGEVYRSSFLELMKKKLM